ncbi:MAG TPA: hypothetical protein VI168_11405 [Croceibacterium sp.]
MRDMNSPPALEWIHEYGWRYPNPQAAQAAYLLLVDGQSPWPDWFTPTVSALQPGTLFQMALSASQTDDHPGAFGTFDFIDDVSEVREDLAVLLAWKPDVQRVTTYRVTEPLPVLVGPIGPQVDPLACQLLQGRFSQFQMLVPAADRMKYLQVVSSRAIQ